ncbi:hypothetical protein NPIL_411041 [Nephila pilipes]|uniref:Uncharacterized protein n=1 Tax=Nephila pilipes TaxID=299642 RepID=A0A8X6IKA6_NEPPI|nr:hypothetical protein NPIL_411041 [Nephila pilipes]
MGAWAGPDSGIGSVQALDLKSSTILQTELMQTWQNGIISTSKVIPQNYRIVKEWSRGRGGAKKPVNKLSKWLLYSVLTRARCQHISHLLHVPSELERLHKEKDKTEARGEARKLSLGTGRTA